MKFAIYGGESDVTSFKPRTARAFCEGRKANADGALISDNPFTTARERENRVAWTAGHSSYTTSSTDKEYCAV